MSGPYELQRIMMDIIEEWSYIICIDFSGHDACNLQNESRCLDQIYEQEQVHREP
jgi:hypothetical protein